MTNDYVFYYVTTLCGSGVLAYVNGFFGYPISVNNGPTVKHI